MSRFGMLGVMGAAMALGMMSEPASGGLEFERRSPKRAEPASPPTDPATETRQMRRARERREAKRTPRVAANQNSTGEA